MSDSLVDLANAPHKLGVVSDSTMSITYCKWYLQVIIYRKYICNILGIRQVLYGLISSRISLANTMVSWVTSITATHSGHTVSAHLTDCCVWNWWIWSFGKIYDDTDFVLLKLLNIINLQPQWRHRHFEYLLCVEFLNHQLYLQSYSLMLQRRGYEGCLAVEAGEDWPFSRLQVCLVLLVPPTLANI